MHHAGVQFGQQSSAMSTNPILHYSSNGNSAPAAHSSAPNVGGASHLNHASVAAISCASSITTTTHSHHETGSTATLRQWRKKDDKFQMDSSTSEPQGPIARVAPHNHNPLPRGSSTSDYQPIYHNQYNYNMIAEPKSFSQVKFAEMVEPQAHQQHLTPVIQKQVHVQVHHPHAHPSQAHQGQAQSLQSVQGRIKEKDYMMCSVVEQNLQTHHLHPQAQPQTQTQLHAAVQTPSQIKSYQTGSNVLYKDYSSGNILHPKESHLNHHPHHGQYHGQYVNLQKDMYAQNYKLSQYQRPLIPNHGSYEGSYLNSEINPYYNRLPGNYRNYRSYQGTNSPIASYANYFTPAAASNSNSANLSVGVPNSPSTGKIPSQEIYRAGYGYRPPAQVQVQVPSYDLRNMSPRNRVYHDVGHYAPPRVSPNLNYNSAQQVEYAQHYQNRRDYPITHVAQLENREVLSKMNYHAIGEHSEIVQNKTNPVLKQFIEGFNPVEDPIEESKKNEHQSQGHQVLGHQPQIPGQNPGENLYILDSTEISSENIADYIHLQVDKLPENIKGFLATNSTSTSVITSPLNLTQDSVIKEPCTPVNPNISVISEVKKNPMNSPSVSDVPASSVIVFGDHNKTDDVDENRNVTEHNSPSDKLVPDNSVIKTTSGEIQNDLSQNNFRTYKNSESGSKSVQSDDFLSPRTPGSTLEEIPKPLNDIEEFLDNEDTENSDMFVKQDLSPAKIISKTQIDTEVPIQDEVKNVTETMDVENANKDQVVESDEGKVFGPENLEVNDGELSVGEKLEYRKMDVDEESVVVKGDFVTLKIGGEVLKITVVKNTDSLNGKTQKVCVSAVSDCLVSLDTEYSECSTQTDDIIMENVHKADLEVLESGENDAEPKTEENHEVCHIQECKTSGLNESEVDTTKTEPEHSEKQDTESLLLEVKKDLVTENLNKENSEDGKNSPVAESEMPELQNQSTSPTSETLNGNSDMPQLDAELCSPHSLGDVEAMLIDNCNEIIIDGNLDSENTEDIDLSLSSLNSPMTSGIENLELTDGEYVIGSPDTPRTPNTPVNLEELNSESDPTITLNSLESADLELVNVVIPEKLNLDINYDGLTNSELPKLKQVFVKLKESDREEVRKHLSKKRKEHCKSYKIKSLGELTSEALMEKKPKKFLEVKKLNSENKLILENKLENKEKKRRRSSSGTDDGKTDDWQIRSKEDAKKRKRTNSDSSISNSEVKKLHNEDRTKKIKHHRLSNTKDLVKDNSKDTKDCFKDKDQTQNFEDVKVSKINKERRMERLSLFDESTNSSINSTSSCEDKARDRSKSGEDKGEERSKFVPKIDSKSDKKILEKKIVHRRNSEKHSKEHSKNDKGEKEDKEEKRDNIEEKLEKMDRFDHSEINEKFISEKRNFSILTKDEKTKTKIKTPSARNKKLESLVESSIVQIQKSEKLLEKFDKVNKVNCSDSTGVFIEEILSSEVKIQDSVLENLSRYSTKIQNVQEDTFLGMKTKTKAQLKELTISDVDMPEKVDSESFETCNNTPIKMIGSTIQNVDVEMSRTNSEINPEISVSESVKQSEAEISESSTLNSIPNKLSKSIIGDRKKLSLAEYKKKRSDKLPSLEDDRSVSKPLVTSRPEDFETLLERSLDATNHSKLNIPAIIETIPLNLIAEEVSPKPPIVIALKTDKNERPTDPRLKHLQTQNQNQLGTTPNHLPHHSAHVRDQRDQGQKKVKPGLPSPGSGHRIGYNSETRRRSHPHVLEDPRLRPELKRPSLDQNMTNCSYVNKLISEPVGEKLLSSNSTSGGERSCKAMPDIDSDKILTVSTCSTPGSTSGETQNNVPLDSLCSTIISEPVKNSEPESSERLNSNSKDFDNSEVNEIKEVVPQESIPELISESISETKQKLENLQILKKLNHKMRNNSMSSMSSSSSGSEDSESSSSDSESSSGTDTSCTDSEKSSISSKLRKLPLARKLKMLADKKQFRQFQAQKAVESNQTQKPTDLKVLDDQPSGMEAMDLNKEIDDIFVLTQKKFEFRPRITASSECDSETQNESQNTQNLLCSSQQQKKRFLINLDEIKTNLDISESPTKPVVPKKKLFIDPDDFNLDDEFLRSSSDSDREGVKTQNYTQLKNIIDLNELLPKTTTQNSEYNPEDVFDDLELDQERPVDGESVGSDSFRRVDKIDERDIDNFINKEPPCELSDVETSLGSEFKNSDCKDSEKTEEHLEESRDVQALTEESKDGETRSIQCVDIPDKSLDKLENSEISSDKCDNTNETNETKALCEVDEERTDGEVNEITGELKVQNEELKESNGELKLNTDLTTNIFESKENDSENVEESFKDSIEENVGDRESIKIDSMCFGEKSMDLESVECLVSAKKDMVVPESVTSDGKMEIGESEFVDLLENTSFDKEVEGKNIIEDVEMSKSVDTYAEDLENVMGNYSESKSDSVKGDNIPNTGDEDTKMDVDSETGVAEQIKDNGIISEVVPQEKTITDCVDNDSERSIMVKNQLENKPLLNSESTTLQPEEKLLQIPSLVEDLSQKIPDGDVVSILESSDSLNSDSVSNSDTTPKASTNNNEELYTDDDVPMNLSITNHDYQENDREPDGESGDGEIVVEDFEKAAISDTSSSNVNVNNSFIPNVNDSVGEDKLPKTRESDGEFTAATADQSNVPNLNHPQSAGETNPSCDTNVASAVNGVPSHSKYHYSPLDDIDEDYDEDISCTIEETKVIIRNLRKGTKKIKPTKENKDILRPKPTKVDVEKLGVGEKVGEKRKKSTIEDISKRLQGNYTSDILGQNPHINQTQSLTQTQNFAEQFQNYRIGLENAELLNVGGVTNNLIGLNSFQTQNLTQNLTPNYNDINLEMWKKWTQLQQYYQMFYYQNSFLTPNLPLQGQSQGQSQSQETQNNKYGVLSSDDLKMKLHRIQPEPLFPPQTLPPSLCQAQALLSYSESQNFNLLQNHEPINVDDDRKKRKKRRLQKNSTSVSVNSPSATVTTNALEENSEVINVDDDYLVIKSDAETGTKTIPKLIIKRSISNHTQNEVQNINNNNLSAIDQNVSNRELLENRLELVPVVKITRDRELDILAYNGRRRRKS